LLLSVDVWLKFNKLDVLTGGLNMELLLNDDGIFSFADCEVVRFFFFNSLLHIS